MEFYVHSMVICTHCGAGMTGALVVDHPELETVKHPGSYTCPNSGKTFRVQRAKVTVEEVNA